ncbi:MAG: hypothetical protein PUC50_08455 [Bacteroidales bacterium]|nr:hypothetical protein [Bacteroidales bacterium]
MFIALIALISCIFIGQLIILGKLNSKISDFKDVFNTHYGLLVDNTIEFTRKANSTFKVIVTCLNSYIENNGNRANDYHLMQDIVERNCDCKEEEIQSQIPTTLYLGLIGTMLGIIVGISELFIGSGLKELLNGTVETNAIENMLKGVAVAMIASAAGITFTTILTFRFKNAKAENANGKNLFLSWIQANLLPAMSSDVNTALDKMSTALSEFNQQFAENTQKLNSTLSLVAQTSESQAQLYNAINQLDIGEMAKANVKVYKALHDSADEIAGLAQMLYSSREYVDSVKQLNANLDQSEKRTQMFEKMGEFFRSEINAIEERKKFFLQTIDEVDKKHLGEFNKVAGRFESNAENAIHAISEKFDNQNNELRKLAAKQEDIVQNSDLSSLPLRIKSLENKISEISSNQIYIKDKLSELKTPPTTINQGRRIESEIKTGQTTPPEPPTNSTKTSGTIFGILLIIGGLVSLVLLTGGSLKENDATAAALIGVGGFLFGIIILIIANKQ